jgi:UDP-N-acetyl-2-amino-2-deoxyglucuronate dehydrogenase
MSGILEPPVNDIWTVPGEEGMSREWKAEDEGFFKGVDPTWHFFKLQLEDFLSALREGREPAVTGREGRETVRLIEAIYASGRAGEAVRPAP